MKEYTYLFLGPGGKQPRPSTMMEPNDRTAIKAFLGLLVAAAPTGKEVSAAWLKLGNRTVARLYLYDEHEEAQKKT